MIGMLCMNMWIEEMCLDWELWIQLETIREKEMQWMLFAWGMDN